uniref:NADH-ubiquinone oxidoreductase chain 3 n=1 Tax=Aradus compar TaxID=1176475 RepID=A0A172DYU5_9HEMI|nr:NADH dehydrogenase subunit 3 [Aradus compar]AFI54700.1 NADH dehydrogenase subunit 3 [Aradus compar]
MLNVTCCASMAITVSLMLMLACYVISKKSTMDREKSSPFECGFDPMGSPRAPFSIQFFLIAVLFLIFDIEIAIIMPMIITLKTSSVTSWVTASATFVTVLILGLYHEWHNGMLEWAT